MEALSRGLEPGELWFERFCDFHLGFKRTESKIAITIQIHKFTNSSSRYKRRGNTIIQVAPRQTNQPH